MSVYHILLSSLLIAGSLAYISFYKILSLVLGFGLAVVGDRTLFPCLTGFDVVCGSVLRFLLA